MSNQEQDLERLRKACGELIEHFDTVHIFATRHESGELNGTVNVNFGKGNWFGRYGQIKIWMTQEEEESRQQVRDKD